MTSGETAGAGYGLDLAFGVARKGEWEFAMAMMEADPIPARAGPQPGRRHRLQASPNLAKRLDFRLRQTSARRGGGPPPLFFRRAVVDRSWRVVIRS